MSKKEKKINDVIARIGDIRYKDKVLKKYENFYGKLNSEYDFLELLTDKMLLKEDVEEDDKRYVLFCFNERVWNNLNIIHRILAVKICNELICGLLECKDEKVVGAGTEKNSYEFGDSYSIHIGNIMKEKPHIILQKIVYEYAFIKNYESILELDENNRKICCKGQ